MTAADLPLGMRLKEQAGWNQLDADWHRALRLQCDGCFVAELDGVPVGTTTTCIFDSVAWIALVLVDVSVRGRGVGKALLTHALAFLDERGVTSVRLDATPLGRPLYAKLGFLDEFPLARYDGVLPSRLGTEEASDIQIALPERDQDPAIVVLDRAITGTDRGKLLRRLLVERPEAFRVALQDGKVLGYCTARHGALATHIGPCLALANAGPLLLEDAWRRHVGQRVFLDVPTRNTEAVRLAESMGLRVARPLFRMCRGPAPAEDNEQTWACFGPEKG